MALSLAKQCVVILIDDDEDEYHLLNYAFQRYSSQITLHQFQEANEIIQHLETALTLPSLILLDMHMPVLNGVEMLQFLKSHQFLKNIPVIVWSGDLPPNEVNRCYEAGASSVILKPSGGSQMEVAINNICNYWFVTVHLPIYAKQANC